ncbi:MAG: ThuA domain-containing protein [Anaerolineales bacterium]
MQIFVLCDDRWHPAQVVRKGLSGLEDTGFEFDWIENANQWSDERMAAYPAVILSKSNNISSADESPWMTEIVQQAFLKYVKRGNGLLAIHSGTAGYEGTAVLRALLGGVFREHPDQCPVTVEPLADHPLSAGSESFTLLDEHYHMDLDDQQAEVFLKTKSQHGTQPGGWRRYEGDGRVCVLTPGHNLEVWQHPAYQRLLLNALRWCSNVA